MKTSRSQSRNGARAAVRIALVTVAVVAAIAAPALRPAQASRIDATSGTASARPAGGKVAALLSLAGKVSPEYLAFLASWPTARLERLLVWLDLGIALEGPWASEELDLVLTVLDAAGATFGEARIVELADEAIEAASSGERHTLRLVKDPDYSNPVGVWYARSGRIVLNEGLFDDAYMQEACNWTFFTGTYSHPAPGITLRHAVIGHEIGHVLIDGLRVELVAAGNDPMALEDLYMEMIEPAQWPHLGYDATEDLASELAVWALRVERTEQVNALRTELSEHFLAASITLDPAP